VFIVLAQDGRTREALADLVDSGGTIISASASFAEFSDVTSTIPNTITEVTITSSGATVTDILQRQVPQPSPVGADSGKCLVAGRGTCSWEQITPVVNTISGTTPTVTPADNNIYNCGELTSLTISNPPATGKYSIIFYSGATATTTVGIENFVAEANKRYKIEVENNYATYDSWDWEGGVSHAE
jgi:hypothetical protein